jgi:hypothetical protein
MLCYWQGGIESSHRQLMLRSICSEPALICHLPLNQTVGCAGTRFPGTVLVTPGYTKQAGQADKIPNTPKAYHLRLMPRPMMFGNQLFTDI